MKMKRYVAIDMRSALRAIRDEQGPDAVILSSRPTAGGVEVCAAVDVELAIAQGAQLEHATLLQLERDAVEAAVPPRVVPPPTVAAQPTAVSPPGAVTQSETDSLIGEELRSLRGLLEQQLAALAWNDFTRREPLKARALTDLANLGLDRSLAREIIDEMPANLSSEQAQRMPYALLGRRLQICAAPIERRGALALVGPPGSGKTTTLSKLATRYVLEQDAANLLIISADDDRLGAHEQLRSLGRLLGVRVESVGSLEEAAARAAALPDRAILIDTPGVACRDTEAAARYRRWRSNAPAHLQAMLTLPASAQGGVIADAVENFGSGTADCCVLTRLDEAVSLGGMLSSLARTQLPIAYCCEGVKIPEDIRPARAHQLIARAMDLARQSQVSADDDLLARRYGRSLHAAA